MQSLKILVFLCIWLLDYCLLSCVIPACSAPGLLPAELRESLLKIHMIKILSNYVEGKNNYDCDLVSKSNIIMYIV